jgi:hypothetical protein
LTGQTRKYGYPGGKESQGYRSKLFGNRLEQEKTVEGQQDEESKSLFVNIF